MFSDNFEKLVVENPLKKLVVKHDRGFDSIPMLFAPNINNLLGITSTCNILNGKIFELIFLHKNTFAPIQSH